MSISVPSTVQNLLKPIQAVGVRFFIPLLVVDG